MSAAETAARMIEAYGQTVTLTRTSGSSSSPWVPGAGTVDVYEFKARVIGAAAQYVDGTVVVASDLMVVAPSVARHTLHNGSAADNAIADLAPRMGDILQIAGADKAIKRIVPATDRAGVTAVYRIFVAS